MQLNRTSPPPGGVLAFSMMEMLFAVALLSLITSTAFFVVSNLRESTLRQNLSRDVTTINSALRVYEANGGSLSDVADMDDLFGRLKRTSSNKDSIAGLRGSFVDPSLDWELVSTGNDRRAVWKPDERRFVIANTGTGVRRFSYSDEKGGIDYGTEERKVSFKLATKDKWVWDYLGDSSSGSSGPTAPTDPPVTPVDPPGPSGGLLQPPVFSVPGKSYASSDFNLQVYLTNPNPTGSSRIRYKVTGGSWQDYDGMPVVVTPDTGIDAFTQSEDPAWRDSGRIFEYYSVVSGNMDMAIAFSKPAYTFKELGGSMVGVTGTSHLAPPGVLQIFSDAMLKTSDDDDDFVVAAYVGGREIRDVELEDGKAKLKITAADFGQDSALWIGAKGYSKVDPTIGAKAEHVVNIDPTTLITPEVVELPRPDGLQVYGEHYIEIAVDTASGDVPEGAQIYYTLDGTDPGDVNGVPTAANIKTYTGPFLVAQPEGQPIKARVYGPDGVKQWFETSSSGEIVWPLLSDVEFTVEVSDAPPNSGGSAPSAP